MAVSLILIAVSVINFNPAGLIGSQQKKNDELIAENMAFHIGVLAYLYGYPLVDTYRQMHNEVNRVSPDQQVYAPVNRFYRYPDIVGPDTAGNLRAPNNDTLYFSGWFDIKHEPVIIHVPDTAGRYYTIAVTNLYAEVTHLGRRTTGTAEGYFALVPPDWQGDLPEDVTPIPVESQQGWLLGRMLVNGPDDFAAAMTLVEGIWLSGLGEFIPGQRPALPDLPVAQAIDPMDSLDFFDIMNDRLQDLPGRPGEEALLAQFDAIGVGPNSNFSAEDLSDASRRGLERALTEGRAITEASTQRTIDSFNGWMISKEIGRYGFNYMQRASVVRGGYGNLPEESMYPAMIFDQNGDLFEGQNQYALRFEAGALPPVDGFWSLSAYGLTDQQLADNEIQRYSIGDRTDGLYYGEDGSLELSIQHERPADSRANWLPTPEGYFMLVIRLYEPAPAALDNSYLLPRVYQVN